IIRDELSRPDQRRVTEIEPGRWWLASTADVAAAAVPLADRVEWAVFSLLSKAGRLSESAFFERVAGRFTGHDLPDEALGRARVARGGGLHLVRPLARRVPLRGRMDRDARRAPHPSPREHPAGREPRPLPRDRARADRARPLQARALAAPPPGGGRRQLAHP